MLSFFYLCLLSLWTCVKMQIDSTQSRIMKLVESTLQLSNFDIAAYYVLKGEKTTTLSATSKIQNDIISPALSDAQVTFF